VAPDGTILDREATVVVEAAIVLGCQTILVHNAFSPNGDGINEVFVIDNLEDVLCYPTNSLQIYNRWGVLVLKLQIIIIQVIILTEFQEELLASRWFTYWNLFLYFKLYFYRRYWWCN
jgi:gliding motility-associated-like protein